MISPWIVEWTEGEKCGCSQHSIFNFLFTGIYFKPALFHQGLTFSKCWEVFLISESNPARGNTDLVSPVWYRLFFNK